MKIYPKAGEQVLDPERGDVVPESGRNVEQTQYWLRRVKDGDVTLKPPSKTRGKR